MRAVGGGVRERASGEIILVQKQLVTCPLLQTKGNRLIILLVLIGHVTLLHLITLSWSVGRGGSVCYIVCVCVCLLSVSVSNDVSVQIYSHDTSVTEGVGRRL